MLKKDSNFTDRKERDAMKSYSFIAAEGSVKDVFCWIKALSVASNHCRAMGCRMVGGGVKLVLGERNFARVNPCRSDQLVTPVLMGWFVP